MNASKLDQCVSEFDTQAQADRYDLWFCNKVQSAIDSSKPRLPHDQVMAEMWAVIDQYAGQKAA